MIEKKYLMENEQEIARLELKTDAATMENQVLWAGLKPGMRVADVGCGSGITTSILYELVQPGGTVVGMDSSQERIQHATDKYGREGVSFVSRDVTGPLGDLGSFDFAWVRFLLEYHRSNSFEIVKNISGILKPGGILCLIDLDNNCLCHHGLSSKMEKTINAVVKILEEKGNFDPFVGRKLYSFLYDLGYEDIQASVAAHHLIYGELNDVDAFNWLKKVEVIARTVKYPFEEYEGGYDEFLNEFKQFFKSKRRFTYTPVISCRGIKPEGGDK